MFTVAICTTADQASLLVREIDRKVDRHIPIKHRAKICPWRYCWLVKVDQFALDVMGWQPYPDLDTLISNQDDMACFLTA